MRTNNKNKSAQPITYIEKVVTNSNGYIEDVIRVELGLTKREHFISMAMQGLLSNSNIVGDHSTDSIDWITLHASLQADSILKQLQNENNS